MSTLILPLHIYFVFDVTIYIFLDCILCNHQQVIVDIQFSSLSRVRLFATPCIAARQASLSITNSRSSLRLTSIESVMPSSHLILCHPLLLLPPLPPSICYLDFFCNRLQLKIC